MKPTYRLYIWIRNAPENRPGGPWWYHDFFTAIDRKMFMDDVIPICHQAYTLKRDALPVHTCMEITPPADAVEVKVNTYEIDNNTSSWRRPQ